MYARKIGQTGSKSRAVGNQSARKSSQVKKAFGFEGNGSGMKGKYGSTNQLTGKLLQPLQLDRRAGAILKSNSVNDYFSADFIALHVANDESEARKIAEHRASAGIIACHVIKRSGLSSLMEEVRSRSESGYFDDDDNRVQGSQNPDQFLSESSVWIYETKYTKKGSLKKTKIRNSKFYYDAPIFGGKRVIHHFDGVA